MCNIIYCAVLNIIWWTILDSLAMVTHFTYKWDTEQVKCVLIILKTENWLWYEGFVSATLIQQEHMEL